MNTLVRYVKTSLLLTAGFLAAFLLLEVGLRLALYGSLFWRQADGPPLIRAPHPRFGWLLQPNQNAVEESLEYQVRVTTNDRGLRDGPHTYEKGPGTYRILLLGDSYMEAAHVEMEHAFSRQMEVHLADHNVETVNLGVGGYATTAAYLYLTEEGLEYSPDLILLAFYAENDVHGNSEDLSRYFWGEDNVRYFGQPYARWNPGTQTLDIAPPQYERSLAGFRERMAEYSPWRYRMHGLHKSVISHVYRQLLDHVRVRVRTPGHDIYIHFGCYLTDFSTAHNARDGLDGSDHQRLWSEAWDISGKLIHALDDTARQHGAAFAMFNAPARIQFEAEYAAAVRERFPQLALDLDLPETRLKALSRERGIPFINLLPAFRAADQAGVRLNYRHDGHWNAAGHALAAEVVAAWLLREGIAPRATDPSASAG